MAETQQALSEQALLVATRFGRETDSDQHLQEFCELATSAGLKATQILKVYRRCPEPKYLIGAAKASELAALAQEHAVALTIVDRDLSPGQIRNLEKHTQTRVISYAGLILDIFAQRAQSHEGKLQVELAQLDYLSTHLIRGWTHLERQKGGIGLRGPGEKQLESDRRLLRRRVATIKKELKRIKCQHTQRKRTRRKNDLPLVALVGYTNSGKSTLFNALTAAAVDTADKLFATLDPITRRLELEQCSVLLSDTVGFIRNLPHELIEAFNATLAEVRDADIIVCVEDAADPNRLEKRHCVAEVLAEIGVAHIKQIRVLNKIDLCGMRGGVESATDSNIKTVCLSALEGVGVELLCSTLHAEISKNRLSYQLRLPLNAAALRAFLYSHKHIVKDRYIADWGWQLDLSLTPSDVRKLELHAGRCGYNLHLLEHS